MLFSAVSALVVAQSSSEIPEGLMNNPVYLNTSQEFVNVVKINTKISPNGVGSLELARRELYDPSLITCLRMDVITLPTLLLQSTPS